MICRKHHHCGHHHDSLCRRDEYLGGLCWLEHLGKRYAPLSLWMLDCAPANRCQQNLDVFCDTHIKIEGPAVKDLELAFLNSLLSQHPFLPLPQCVIHHATVLVIGVTVVGQDHDRP